MAIPKEAMNAVCPDGSLSHSTPTEMPPAPEQSRRKALYSAVRSHMLESVRPSGFAEVELLLLTM